MKHVAVCTLLIAALTLGTACSKTEDRTNEAIQAAESIVKNTIVKIDAITAKVKNAKTAAEAASLVGEFLTTALSIKDEVGGLEQRFPAKSLDKNKVEAALKNVMNETKAAGQRFGAALMALPTDIRESGEVAEALKKLQGAM